MKKAILLISLALLSLGGYILYSTGFFRSIDSEHPRKVVAKIPIAGAEDIVVSPTDGFALISATERKVYPPKEPEEGALYYLDLMHEILQPINLTQSLELSIAPHGIDMLKIAEQTFLILAVNHANNTHTIEQFILEGTSLSHQRTYKHPSMIQPNDVVILSTDEFYFTNDHGYTKGLGKLIEEYSGIGMSNVIRVKKSRFEEVAQGIAYANGIAYNPQKQLVYVASPRGFAVLVYARNEKGGLNYIKSIPAGTGVDNLTLDTAGKIWIGAHPNLLRFKAYAQGKYAFSPSEIVVIGPDSKGEPVTQSWWVDNGEIMSGATVAVPYKEWVLVGNVMDKHFVILQR